MAIHIRTSNPELLLKNIKYRIQLTDNEVWLLDDDGDFTIIKTPWYKNAWLRPYDKKSTSELIIGILGKRDQKMSKGVYSVYHARFSEMLLTLFDLDIIEIRITSMPESGFDFL